MKFINKGEPIKIRIGEPGECYWTTLKRNEVVELAREQGLILGLEEVKTTEGKLGDLSVQTKQIETVNETDDFFKELCSIKGIGKKTAKDVIRYSPTKEILIEKIKTRDGLPFRDDVEIKLRDAYGA